MTPIADPALLTTGTTTGTEDTDVPFGADISLAGVDLDGSETMEVVLTGIRPGATVYFDTGLWPAPSSRRAVTITIAGSPQEVAALLATVGVTPAEHDGEDFTVGRLCDDDRWRLDRDRHRTRMRSR